MFTEHIEMHIKKKESTHRNFHRLDEFGGGGDSQALIASRGE